MGVNEVHCTVDNTSAERSFDYFDFDRVSAYDEMDIERIMGMEGMIRFRRKIEAVIHNARCFQKIRTEMCQIIRNMASKIKNI